MFIDKTSPAKNISTEIINAIHCRASADKLKSFHIPSFGSTKGKDTVLDEHVKTQRIDALLIYHHKAFFRIAAADFLLQLHNLTQFFIHEATFALNKLFTLICARIVKARIHLGFLVF